MRTPALIVYAAARRGVSPPAIVIALLLLRATTAAHAQSPRDSLVARPTWSSNAWVGNRATLELELSRPLADTERLALIVGDADVSSLVHVRGTSASYRPTARRLSSGETRAVAYVVSSDGRWSEIGGGTVRVRTAAGLERGTFSPSADLTTTGPVRQGWPQGDPEPERLAYQDGTLRAGIQGSATRAGWEWSVQGNAMGVTQPSQRLRWGDAQERAPSIDLADYRLQLSRGKQRVFAGNLVAGLNRHLLNSFSSRGVGAGIALGRAVTLDATMLNGTNVLGWTNMLGLAESQHRIATSAVSVELMPSRPGAVHVDITAMDGSILPRTGYTQGAVTDAEQSKGYGAQVALSDAAQRLRLSAGVSRSRFINPSDPLLSGDTLVVAARPAERGARYGELGVQLLRDHRLFDSLRISLGATVRHERVDPLYRSVGTFLQADLQQDGAELTGNIGALSWQAAAHDGRDNLARIRSILTSRTRRRTASASLPLHAMLRRAATSWLPTAQYSTEHTRQFGEGIPENSEFAATHVPDQQNVNESAQLAWTVSSTSLTYRWNRARQDNRQVGRDAADFLGSTHTVSIGVNGLARVNASVDASIERQNALEQRTQQRASRLGATGTVQLTPSTTFASTLSHQWGWDPFAARRQRNLELQGELSQGFTVYANRGSGTQGRVFLRFARTRAEFLPVIADPTLFPRLSWSVNAGGSFRVF